MGNAFSELLLKRKAPSLKDCDQRWDAPKLSRAQIDDAANNALLANRCFMAFFEAVTDETDLRAFARPAIDRVWEARDAFAQFKGVTEENPEGLNVKVKEETDSKGWMGADGH